MAQNLIRTKLEGTLQAGSLRQLVKERQHERETFILLDCSYSMEGPVTMGSGMRKIDALRREAGHLREQVRCRHVGFGLALYGQGLCVDFLDGAIPEPQGQTPLAEAIRFSKSHGAKHLVVVSDGLPDSEADALRAASEFAGVIDVVYIGQHNDIGEAFLKQLAAQTHGQCQHMTLAQPRQLTSAIRGLLTAGESP